MKKLRKIKTLCRRGFVIRANSKAQIANLPLLPRDCIAWQYTENEAITPRERIRAVAQGKRNVRYFGNWIEKMTILQHKAEYYTHGLQNSFRVIGIRASRGLVFIFLLLFFVSCEDWPVRHYSILIVNNSEFAVSAYFALGRGTWNSASVFPDTTISFERSMVGCRFHGRPTLPGSVVHFDIQGQSWDRWFELWLPQDTLSIFIFDNMVLNRFSWSVIQRDYMVLKRYDLSLDDLRRLHNRFGEPEIPFPPDERMRDMRMFPPFGE